jgi:hypothetical protein
VGEADSVMMAVSSLEGGSSVTYVLQSKHKLGGIKSQSQSYSCLNENEESTRFYSKSVPSVHQLKFSRDGMVCPAHVINLAGWRSRLGNCTRMGGTGETGYSRYIAFPLPSIDRLLSTKYLLETHLAQ